MFWIASLACSTVLTVPLRKMSCNFLGKQFSTCRVESVQVETIKSLYIHINIYIYIFIIKQGLHDMLISLNVSWLGLGHPQSCCISSGMVPSGPRSACRPSPLHGIEGTPAVCARMLALALRLYISRCDAMCLPTSSNATKQARPFSLSITSAHQKFMVAKDGLRQRPRHSNLVTQH